MLIGYCEACPDICKIVEERILLASRRAEQGLKIVDGAHGHSMDRPMAADTIKQPVSIFEALAHEESGRSSSFGWSRMDVPQEWSCRDPQETMLHAVEPTLVEFKESPSHLQAKRLRIERLPKSWDIHNLRALIQETPSLCMCCDVDKIVMLESGVALVALKSERCANKWHQKLSNMMVGHSTGIFPLKVSVADEIRENIPDDCCENKEKSLLDKMLTECKNSVQANSETTLLAKLLDC